MNDPQPLTSRGWSIIKKTIFTAIIAIVIIIAVIIIMVVYLSYYKTKQSRQLSPLYSTDSIGMETASFDQQAVKQKMIMPEPSSTPPSASNATTIEQKVIKTGNLDIMVDNVEEAVNKITNQVTALSGFVQNSNVSEMTTGQKYASLVLRVPAKNFENLIAKIKSLAKLVQRENIYGQEVTEEYVDLQADLTHNLAVEQQYLELLKRAQKVEEIIAVRDKLDQVQGEIERIKGRIRYLNNQTEMSTITVNITSEVKVTLPAEKWQPWEIVKKSAQKLIVNLQNFVNFIINLIFILIALIPYALLILLIYLLVKWIYKKYKKPKQM